MGLNKSGCVEAAEQHFKILIMVHGHHVIVFDTEYELHNVQA